MTSRSTILLALAAVACARAPRPSAPSPAAPAAVSAPTAPQADVHVPADSAAIRAIVREGTTHSHVAADFEYLTDVIGPRLTGSEALRRANNWTADRLRAYGMDSVWQEAWRFGQAWQRGPMTLAMLAPQQRQLIGVSWAWAPGTNGPLAGDVVYVDAATQAEFNAKFAGKLRGAWVMVGPPALIPNPDGLPLTAADSARLAEEQHARRERTQSPEAREFARGRNAALAREGIAGLVREGAKDFALMTMSGSPAAIYPFPVIVVSHEDYSQFYRLLQQGQPVRIEASISNTLTRDTVDAYNTVAEIRGTEKPDEVVLLGAHLDSWDLATGATDNGAGSIAVLEAARILKASGVKPKRTIRFVLFTGEEEGLFGSEHYAADHRAELPKLQAVLVLDNGTGRITGMSLQGRRDLWRMWDQLFAPVSELGPFTVQDRNKGGTDHLSFLPYGVPGFNYDQLVRGYNHTHHSQVDDFDHAVPEDIAQAATVMAANAYLLANLPELLPRNPAPTNRAQR